VVKVKPVAGAPQTLSKAAYARHRGVSAAMVTKWGHAGRLVMEGGQIDVAKTDELLMNLQDRSRGGKRSRGSVAVPPPQGEAATGAGSGSPGSVPDAAAPIPQIVAATTADRWASADLKRAKADRELGRLVSREHFEAACEHAFALARDGCLNLAPRLGNAVAEALGVDARVIFPILEDEARRIANEVADALEGLADSVEATQQ